MSQYPCPRCGAEVDEPAGCPICGAPPDPVAAELAQLRRRVADLDQRDFALRQEYATLVGQRQQVSRRIDELWGRVLRGVPAGPPPAGAPVTVTSGVAPPRPAPPSRPETSTRSVQTVLLVLGGILLGVAAVVFTAVAWATFGVTGRAVILASVTTVALAVPVLLRRRELTATAETVAALALLLVLLDGYAAWTVDLAGVQTLSPTGYTALVFAVTAGLAAGYQSVSRLVVPWLAALLCAQPVLPLLAIAIEPNVVSCTAGFAVTAAGNLTVLGLLRRTPVRHRPLRFLAVALFLVTAALAGLLSTLTLALTVNLPQAIGAGVVLAATAALGVVAASGTERRPVRALAAGLAAVALTAAVAGPMILAIPGYVLLITTTVTVLVWTAARLLPEVWRGGATIGCAVTGGLLAPPAIIHTAGGAAAVLAAVPPVWHTNLPGWPGTVASAGLGWQPLVVLALLATGSLLLSGKYRYTAGHHAAVAGMGLVILGAPAGLGLPWWSPVVLGIGAGVGAAMLAAVARGDGAPGRTIARGIVGAVLLSHTIAASLVRPGVTSAALVATAAGLIGVAALAVRPGGQRVVGGISSAVAVAVLPAATGSAGVALHWPQEAVLPAMVAAASIGLAATALLRFTGSGYLRYAVTGLGLATATTSLSVLATDQPVGVYAAVSGLIGVAAGTLLPNRRATTIGTAGLPLLVALLNVLPAVLVVGQTYLWLAQPWQDAGSSTSDLLSSDLLSPEPGLLAATFDVMDVWDPVTLALLTVACGLLGYATTGQASGSDRRFRMAAAMLPGVAVTLLVASIGFDWPWPMLPATALTVAVLTGLVAGLTTPDSLRPLRAVLIVIWPVVGSIGLANCLATQTATLVGLTVVSLTALVVALRGGTTLARITGWVITGTSGVALVEAAGRIAGLPPEQRGYGALAIAVVLLGAAALLPTSQDSEILTVERLSFAAAGFAVLTAQTSLPAVAIILAGYGALLGLSALRPGRRRLVFGGIGCELLAWWVFLRAEDVGLVEAYAVPLGLAALAGGLLELRHRPELTSWQAYGLALIAIFLPSISVIANGDDPPARRLGLGLAALIVVVAGAARRRQAPVVVGGAVLALLSVRELASLWELLPRWLPLAAAGLILLTLGATYEQRRRDARRLRDALGRMT